MGSAEIGEGLCAGIGIEIDRQSVHDLYEAGKVVASAVKCMGGEAKVRPNSGETSAVGSGLFEKE